MEAQQPLNSQEQASSLPRLDTLSQTPVSTRSVEVDVQRLADIRASLQDLQRRKSTPPSNTGAAKLSAQRHSVYASSISPQQQASENMYQPFQAASSTVLPARQQPFAPRDLNKDIKVELAHASYGHQIEKSPRITSLLCSHLRPQHCV